MAKVLPTDPRQEKELWTIIHDPKVADNPEKFVEAVFPWGKRGTDLEHFSGPRNWQRRELRAIGEHLQENIRRIKGGKEPLMYRSATSSGRGIGKSSLTAWLILWFMSTRVGSTTIVAANTEAQLKTRTWAELGKWLGLSINRHWFDLAAMSLKPQEWFATLLQQQMKLNSQYYYASAQTWSEENPDAFAGVHNQRGVMVIFDEASGIPSPIWTVTSGFFTEPTLHRYHFAFSNPRRNTGDFFECFHKKREYWRRVNIDSREVEGTDKGVLQQIIEQHGGEDSDVARVEVRGLFPRQGDKQFISREVVKDAIERVVEEDPWAPLIMGVDPARFGDDATVIRFRQGRNAKIIPPQKLRGADNMQVANLCAHLIEKYNPDAVCIDAGNGTGIIDRLREMGFKVHEVWFGAGSPEPEYANFRTYMWAQMREWLRGGCIDNDSELIDDLTSPEYRFMGSGDKIALETKEQLKNRGFSSPDNADALACTFAKKVARSDLRAAKRNPFGSGRTARDVDYPFFG